jgi:FKBP-type peptidyl-prolyl cis-trans isomerase
VLDDDNASETSTEETASTDQPSETVEESAEHGDRRGSSASNPDKPEVEVPDEIPTELEVTVIEEGTGPEAEAGDTVIVDYLGVRAVTASSSTTATTLDKPATTAQPFTLVLGEGQRDTGLGSRPCWAFRAAHASDSTFPPIWHTASRVRVTSSARTKR